MAVVTRILNAIEREHAKATEELLPLPPADRGSGGGFGLLAWGRRFW